MQLFSKNKNERGVALLLVLSAVMILTTALLEFIYTERVNYQLAVNAKQRLQAYYLARSALNFSKLLLKYHKQTEKTLASAGETAQSLMTEPIYKMLPLSSDLIRGVLSGGITELDTSAGKEAADSGADTTLEPTGNEEEKNTSVKLDMSGIASDKASEFLSFDGDFLAEITEEQSKYDLNKIYNTVSTSAAYDQRKKLLLSLLLLPKFQKDFENQDQDAPKLVHALADWVDQNGIVNEFDNVSRGNEDSAYQDVNYKPKNGKMLTLSETRLVSGMNDDILSHLKDDVTLYTNSDKINICLNIDGENTDWIKALIYHYTHNSGCVSSPIDYRDEDKMTELVDAILELCPDVNAMSSALNSALGLVEASSDDSESTSATTAGANVTGCAFQFKDLITSDNKVFTVKATGTVGETNTSIIVVMNIQQDNPSKWKYYYYRIE